MKTKINLWPIVVSALFFQGCGGGGLLGDDESIDMLEPDPPAIDYTKIPRPDENANVITTDNRYVYDANGDKVDLRGVELKYYMSPEEMLPAIDAIAGTGANVLRLLIDKETTAEQLQAALDKVVENNMVVIVTMTGTEDEVYCTDAQSFILNEGLVGLWFGEWHEVLIQDEYQSHVIINFAHGWGPDGIFNSASLGYSIYIDAYKAIIGVFRNAGFKVPIMVDAPGCGADFNAFVSGRGRQLRAADPEQNIILAANARGPQWNSSDRVNNANSIISLIENMPFFMSGFTGSEVGYDETEYVDHLDIMAKGQGDQGVRIDFQWGSDADGGSYAMALPETTDLTGGAVSLDVFLDRPLLEYRRIDGTNNYAPFGTLTVATFIRDVNGNELLLSKTESKDIRQYVFNTLRGDIPEPDAIDPSNIVTGDEFDQSSVTHVGVQIMANGKPANVNGDILFDNLRLFPGVPPMLALNFTDSTDGWSLAWGDATIGQADGTLTVLPTGDQVSLGLQASTVQTLDFNKDLRISFDIFMPEGYPSGLWMSLYGMFGDGWSWVDQGLGIAGAVPGQWTTITTRINWSTSLDVSLPQALGILTGGYAAALPSEPMLIDNFIVEDVNARPTKTITATQYRETFRNGAGAWTDLSGWGGGGDGAVEVIDEALVVSAPGAAAEPVDENDTPQNGAISNEAISGVQEIDFGGPIVVKLDILIPSALDGTEAYFDVFIQDGQWNHFVVGTIRPADVTLGEWTSFEYRVEAENYPANFNRNLSPQRFGVAYTNVMTAVQFQLDNLEIVGDTIVDDLQPIFEVDFNEVEEVQALTAVSGTGTQNTVTVEAAKSADWHIVPFGWTASTWFGAENDDLGLDISNSISPADLTERGEEIVNGENGIAETAGPVSF